jgi:hypothetical protein
MSNTLTHKCWVWNAPKAMQDVLCNDCAHGSLPRKNEPFLHKGEQIMSNWQPVDAETIHLLDGTTVQAEVNGKTLDGQRGEALLFVDTGNLRGSLAESTEIEVERLPDGSWREVRQS